MPATHDLARATRARPVRFSLPGGVEVTVKPPSLDRVIDVLRLDPAEGAPETPLAEYERLRRQARALIGAKKYPHFARLDAWQIGLVISTLYVAANGLDAEAFARWQVAQRTARTRLEIDQSIENLERMSVELAPFLQKAPREVGAEPLADLVALQASITRFRNDQRQFDAGIHGCTVS